MKTVKRAYKFRFYPSSEQAELLNRTFGCVRLVFNLALEARAAAWKSNRRNLSYADTSAMLTQWKQCSELAFLKEVSSVPLQQSLRHLHSGFKRFWKKQSAYPRFKSKRRSKASAEFTASAFRWDGEQLRLAKMPEPLQIVWSRSLPANAVPSTVTVSRDRADRWFVSILVEETLAKPPAAKNKTVGIDLGLESLAVLSTGEKIDNPRHERKDRTRLIRAQRRLARKQKGSANFSKARVKVARIYAAIADRRRDHLHKLTTRLVRENQTVVIENLSIQQLKAKGGRRKTGLNRTMSDASWGALRSMLEYKSRWRDRHLIVIEPWFPSTQLCSQCGAITGPKSLDVRVWTCACGTHHDRDVNAAKNLLAAGLAATVCGDGRRLVRGHA